MTFLFTNKKLSRFLLILTGIFFISLSEPASAQIQHKKLRQEILNNQQPKTPVKSKTRKKNNPALKPLPVLAPVAPVRSPFDLPNVKIIYMENADLISFDQLLNPDFQVLRGHVKFRHDDATLSCDSAYFYKNSNSLDAFGNVKIVQGDTLFVYGDILYYDGNSKLARMRERVRMVNRKTTLTTDSLNYDRTTQIAYYFTGGKIVDAENTLTSVWGQYSTATEDALFKNTVKLKNKNFIMDSDTLKYNTKSHIANLVGKTHIIYQDETDIYTDKGWYNTETERSMLLNRSLMVNKEGKSITGDTIFYDKSKKFGESYGKVELNDTIQKSTLYGNYVYYNEDTELGIATDSALLIDWSDQEKKMYIHADTLQTQKDSVYHTARAWNHARFYRKDIQGMTDSLFYSSRDSMIHLYKSPVLWQESQQLSSDQIHIYTKNKKVDKMHLDQSALSIQRVDSLYFNQLSGKEITAFMDSGQLKRVEVNGNAETVYFARDDVDSTLIGANKTVSSLVVMHFKDKKIDRIILTTASEGTFCPIDLLKDEFIYLENFFWIENQRPQSGDDVFKVFSSGDRPKFDFIKQSERSSKEEPKESEISDEIEKSKSATE
jgi:lipopolysaccharide export system protein LptA